MPPLPPGLPVWHHFTDRQRDRGGLPGIVELWSLINNQLWTTNSEHQRILNNQLWTSSNSEQSTLIINQLWTLFLGVECGGAGKAKGGMEGRVEVCCLKSIQVIKFVGWYSDWKIFVQMMTFVKRKYPDRKTEEEILTLRQVLTAKERHAAGKIDNWPHTNWKILHQNDEHTISVERFCKI